MNQLIAKHTKRFLHHNYMNNMHKCIFLAFLTLLFFHPVFAQDIVFTVTSPDSVTIGEGFSVNYTINRNADSIHIKSFENFELIGGPNKSSSVNTSIIKGKETISYENSFTYDLKPVKKGVFRIPAATIQVKGEKYFSDSAIIIITDTSKKLLTDSNDEILSNELYIDLTLSKQEAYVQEPVIATLKLYSKYDISAIDNITLPGCDNFLSYNISDSIITPQKEMVKGNKFTTAIVKKMLLYPLMSGNFQLGGGKFTCTVRKPIKKSKEKSTWDNFFEPFYKTLDRHLEINTQLITIRPLPENKPLDYNHFCGSNLKVIASVNTNRIKAHILFNYEITLSGKGNLKLATIPDINLPLECKEVSHGVINYQKKKKDGITGFLTFRYTIMPEQTGSTSIPEQSFSYFDLDTKKYQTVTTNPISLTIEKKIPAPVSTIRPMPKTANERTEESNLMIVMDVSATMFARDLKPNRLESSVNATKKFLQQLKGKAGIIIFSDDSKVKCPLRSNLKVVSDSMNKLIHSEMGDGTAIGFGLCNAILQLKKSNTTAKTIVLITDGENNTGSVSPKMAVRIAGSFGIKIFVIGVSGKDSAAEYPCKTPTGIEISKLPVHINESSLNEIATITGGKYFRADNDRSFDEIYKEIGILVPLKNNSGDADNIISQEDAERILNAVSQDMDELREKVKK